MPRRHVLNLIQITKAKLALMPKHISWTPIANRSPAGREDYTCGFIGTSPEETIYPIHLF